MTRRRTVNAETEAHLNTYWEALMVGEIRLWGLPPSVAAFYHAGYEEGRESRQQEVDALESEIARLRRDVDVYWARAFLTHDERRERLLQRLDEGLEQADAAAWDRIEKEVALMVRKRNYSIESGLEPTVGGTHDVHQYRSAA